MAIFEEKDRAALYVHLRSFESDYDRSQSQMRAISSAWSAAVLTAVALVVTSVATPIVVPKDGASLPQGIIEIRADAMAYLRTVICWVGSAGVLAFWYIDQGVYQRLLHSVFAYGMFAEYRDERLPQIRSSMFIAHLDVTNQLGNFYRTQFWAFPALSIFINTVSCYKGTSVPSEVWWMAGAHVFVALCCEVVSYGEWPSLDRTILNLYPDMAASLPLRPDQAGLYGQLILWIGRQFARKGNRSPIDSGKHFGSSTTALLNRVRHQK